MFRCLNCKNCQYYQKQMAAYSAAISERRDEKDEQDLIAEWNSLKDSESFRCLVAPKVPHNVVKETVNETETKDMLGLD